jgi:hypothetical protein
MKKFYPALFLCLMAQFIVNNKISAQGTDLPASKDLATTAVSLFDRDSILEISLHGQVRELLNDRADNPQYHALWLDYVNEHQSKVTIALEAKTRGHFRKLRENCVYPPILLNFSKSDSLKTTLFSRQSKLKLVMPCQGEQFIIREWLVYKLYNLVTPKSFRARLVKVTLEETKQKKNAAAVYGILLEEEEQMAKRNGAIAVTRKLNPEQTERSTFLTMAVFEYLAGNTDWSVQFLQNIKLIAADSNAVASTVPYDFDHAGLVSPPYALPAEELNLASVRERRYRGYCVQDIHVFDSTLILYNQLKPSFYAIYSNCSYLDDKTKKTILKFLDGFYATINDPVALKKAFMYPCDKNGTGNVVIRGLKEE